MIDFGTVAKLPWLLLYDTCVIDQSNIIVRNSSQNSCRSITLNIELRKIHK